MTEALEIYLWGTRIGTAWQPSGDLCVKFEYDRQFLKSKMELSPFRMPLRDSIYGFPELSRVDSYLGLPGLLADSLPDRFGTAVTDRWLQSRGIAPDNVTMLERLRLVGKRGMGALEYFPSDEPERWEGKIDVNEMAETASQILAGSNGEIPSDRLMQMMEIGSVAGGARAKAVVTWNERTNEIYSGEWKKDQDCCRQWLIKFDGVDGNGDRGVLDKKQYTRIEYAYYRMAVDAGIEMQECRLLEKDGRCHFMTLRYDREDGRKLHAQTLSSLGHFDYNQPRSCSYELYANFANKLHSSLQEKKQLFRRAAFHFAAVNCDDHVKNFSFLMDRRGEWRMTPAYDVTFAYVPGHQWLGTHQMTLNGKSAGIDEGDLLTFGRKIGLTENFCREALHDVTSVVGRWMTYAQDCGIAEERATEIADVINLAGLARA